LKARGNTSSNVVQTKTSTDAFGDFNFIHHSTLLRQLESIPGSFANLIYNNNASHEDDDELANYRLLLEARKISYREGMLRLSYVSEFAELLHKQLHLLSDIAHQDYKFAQETTKDIAGASVNVEYVGTAWQKALESTRSLQSGYASLAETCSMGQELVQRSSG
jgi:hypothetical protein